MTSKDIGLIEKYRVERTDGKIVRWCFVLEDTDPLAKPAILVYADLAEAAGYLDLAADLRKEVSGLWPRLRMEPLPDDGRRSAEDDWHFRIEPR